MLVLLLVLLSLLFNDVVTGTYERTDSQMAELGLEAKFVDFETLLRGT